MKRTVFLAILIMSLAINIVEGQTIGELFIKSPEPEFLLLTASDRMDLIDLYKDGKNATVKNRFRDSCSLLRLTDDYIQLKTGNNTIELFLLSMINDSKIVGLINTVCAPVCDSSIEFFTTNWRKLSSSVFINIAGKTVFLKDGVDREDEKVKNALILLDISLMKFHYEPEKKELQQFFTTPDYLSEDDRREVRAYLKVTPKIYRWNSTRFE